MLVVLLHYFVKYNYKKNWQC